MFIALAVVFSIPNTFCPIVFGEEVALIKRSGDLCLGKIGTSGCVCLKLSSECMVEAHSKKRAVMDEEPLLIQLRGDDKGYAGTATSVKQLDDSFIDELLSKRGLDWTSELAVIESLTPTSSQELKDAKDTVVTAKKIKSFATPAKNNASAELGDSLDLMTASAKILEEVFSVRYDESGQRVDQQFQFDSTSYMRR